VPLTKDLYTVEQRLQTFFIRGPHKSLHNSTRVRHLT